MAGWMRLRSVLAPLLFASPAFSGTVLAGLDGEARALYAGCEEGSGNVDWELKNDALWDAVEDGALTNDQLVEELFDIQQKGSPCVLGVLTSMLVLTGHKASTSGLGVEELEPILGFADKSRFDVSWGGIISAGFPFFGALGWVLRETAAGSNKEEEEERGQCSDEASQAYLRVTQHHLAMGTLVPTMRSLGYLGSAAATHACVEGRVSALLALAVSHASVLGQPGSLRSTSAGGSEEEEEEGEDLSLVGEVWHLVGRAEHLLRQSALNRQRDVPVIPSQEWPVWVLLHQLSRAFRRTPATATPAPDGCLVMIYAFPTEEIKRDTAEALRLLEEHYFQALGVRYPLVVFVDPATAETLQEDLGPFTSAPLIPAVIPQEEVERPMSSYSCVDGIVCEVDAVLGTSAHRGVVNQTQFWSPDYLRISRYTAGPLFQHPALDTCGPFLKLDSDFYFTAPLKRDPLEEIRTEGARLAYWQIHVQGQRQQGFMNAAVSFLQERGLKIKNRSFYARGSFEEKAEKLGIPLEEVPEALEAATVIYGCLFGGDVRFFREPLYQDFFEFMDRRRGFETAGWSNQFFLGLAAAAFLDAPQVRRLYIAGRHQESNIGVDKGNVTEYLTGSSNTIFR